MLSAENISCPESLTPSPADEKLSPFKRTPLPLEENQLPPEDTPHPPEQTSMPPEQPLEETLPPPEPTSLPPEETLMPPKPTSLPPEETLLPPEPISLPPEQNTLPREQKPLLPERVPLPLSEVPPPPSIDDLPDSFHHDYDTLSPEKDQNADEEQNQGLRVKHESGVDDEDFVDAEENLPDSNPYSPVDGDRNAKLEELRQPAKIEEPPVSLDAEDSGDEAIESPTSTLVDRTAEATLKLIGNYADMDRSLNLEKSPEHSKSMFDRIKAFFDEPKEVEPDQETYAPVSITTSKCSVCQGLHKSGSSGSSPDNHDFSIYGPLTINGSPDSTGSFCPICQTRAEHEEAVKSNTHG